MTAAKPRLPLAPGETRAYPVLPLRDMVVFPHTIAPLCVPRTPSLIDYVIESPNVGGDDRSVTLPPGPVRLAVQVEVQT
jgi:hypothetical protein